MIDLGFGNLSLGDILHKNDHAAVFHRLHGELERPPVEHIDPKGVVLATRKPGVQAVDQTLRVETGNHTCRDNTFNQIAYRRALQLEIRRQSHLLIQLLV